MVEKSHALIILESWWYRVTHMLIKLKTMREHDSARSIHADLQVICLKDHAPRLHEPRYGVSHDHLNDCN